MGGLRVNEQWAWTPEEASQNARSPAVALLYSEAARVQRNFASKNPGYALGISPLRSLEKQVSLWNRNHSITKGGSKLLTAAIKGLENKNYPDPASHGAAIHFAEFLRRATVIPEPTSAAPGTSDHGQAHAVDFVVMRGNATIAGTETTSIVSIWKAQGWEAKADRCHARHAARRAPSDSIRTLALAHRTMMMWLRQTTLETRVLEVTPRLPHTCLEWVQSSTGCRDRDKSCGGCEPRAR